MFWLFNIDLFVLLIDVQVINSKTNKIFLMLDVWYVIILNIDKVNVIDLFIG